MTIAPDGSTPAAVNLTASTSSTATTASFSPPSGSLVGIPVNTGATSRATPPSVNLTASTSSTATTASFSPPSGSLVGIAVNIGYSAGNTSVSTVTVKDSASVAYTSPSGASTYSTAYGSYSGVFTHYYATAPGSITVTATRSGTGSAGAALFQLVPYVLDGAASSQSGAYAGSSDSISAGTTAEPTVTPTVTGSWVIIAVAIDNNTTMTAAVLTTDYADTTDTTDTEGAGAGHIVTGTPGAVSGVGFTLGASSAWSYAALEILPGSSTIPATATLSGSGSLSPAKGAFGGAAALSGSGTLATPVADWRLNALTGSGTLTASGSAGIAAMLSGSGSLTAGRAVTWAQGAALSGSGTLSAAYFQSALTGTGTLGISGVRLSYPLALSGTGTLAVLQVLGGLVSASAGVAAPYAYPGTSQVAVAPPGSTAWAYLGSLGVVTALTYSFTCPGGCDAMTCTIMVPAAYRTQLFNPGWQVRITRGGHQVWDGKLDEPVPTSGGWNLTAVGAGNRGTDFLAVYSGTWPSGQPDASINAAISRGLAWANPGVGTPSGAWFGQGVDSGAQTITALLNLICTRGGLTWMVNSQPGGVPGDDLSVFPLPTVVNRLLVCTTPVARTLGGDINTIYIRYEISADTTSGTTSVPAVYGTTVVQNAASVAAHGEME